MPFNRQNERRRILAATGDRITRQVRSAGSEKLIDLAAIRDARSTLQSVNLARWRSRRSPASGRWTEANEAIKTARKALDAARDAVQRAIDADD